MGVKLLVLAAAAAIAPQALPVGELPSYQQPARAWADLHDASKPESCRRRIQDVRVPAELTLKVDRSPAIPGAVPVKKAVVYSENGCPVPVLVNTPAPPPKK